ncbi:aminopeptidase [bacterium]|nr:aminopeptidase [bacterium]
MRFPLISSLALLALGCTQNEKNNDSAQTPGMNLRDPHSFARPDQRVGTHLHLELGVDFEQKILEGTALWTLHGDGDSVVFDTHGLEILGIAGTDGAERSYQLDTPDPVLGQALRIALEAGDTSVVIRYRTGSEAKALQWLGHSLASTETDDVPTTPFLFTQSQAILARTWVPCQDVPGIRFTYTAKVQVPPGMLALMSASNPKSPSADGSYSFEMPQPIPSYLLALAVGNLGFQSLGARSGVYAPPGILGAAAYEFAETEQMIAAAEALYGPYAWGRYDLLVLPPSFPFGGMENPRLTFATPTILAGDRSLVALVAHELAHSWSGNLVTNAHWADFWLNEGFTVYFENRIMEAVYGREYSEMLAALSHEELKSTVAEMMASAPNDTKLKLDLNGRNPDDGVTAIAYDKGYHFLRLIEETVGRPRFDAFLKTYFAENAFKVMDTERFLARLNTALLSPEESAQIGVDRWVYETGLPDNLPVPKAVRFEKIDALAAECLKTGRMPEDEAVTRDWSTHEWLRFVERLEGAPVALLYDIDRLHGLCASRNAEIAAAWYVRTLKAAPSADGNWTYVPPTHPEYSAHLERFVLEVGRRKFIVPIYKALIEAGLVNQAKALYTKARPGYHAVAQETLDALMVRES